MIGKLKGVIDSYGEDFIVLDVQGVGYLVHCSARTLQALPARRRGGDAVDRNARARRPDPPVRLSQRHRARMVPPAADRAGRRREGGAVGAEHVQAGRSRLGDRDGRQGRDQAHAGRRPQGRRAHRHRAEGQGAGVFRRSIRPSSACPARWKKSARRSPCSMRCRRWSISATVSRRPRPPSPPPRAARARARRPRN